MTDTPGEDPAEYVDAAKAIYGRKAADGSRAEWVFPEIPPDMMTRKFFEQLKAILPLSMKATVNLKDM